MNVGQKARMFQRFFLERDGFSIWNIMNDDGRAVPDRSVGDNIVRTEDKGIRMSRKGVRGIPIDRRSEGRGEVLFFAHFDFVLLHFPPESCPADLELPAYFCEIVRVTGDGLEDDLLLPLPDIHGR